MILAYTLFGKRLRNSSYGGLLGKEDTFERTDYLINQQTMSIMFSSCLANSIILIQLTELSSIETDILISIMFGAVIYPTTIAWTSKGGWLYLYGFTDPSDSTAVLLLPVVCGLVGNLHMGLKFEDKHPHLKATVIQ